jgi:hypothetical protein
MKSATMTTKQAATFLNLSRVRVLGLAKQGKLVATKGVIAGTTIPQVLFDAESVKSYVPSRSGGMRAMIVKLPAEQLAELERYCSEQGWTIRAKNVKNVDDVEELNEELDEEVEA